MSDGTQVSQDEKEIHMKHGESGGPEPLTFTHNGQPATVDLKRFTRQAQKEIHMKHGEIGAPRNTGDVGVAPVPEVGSVKIVILNGSRQIDQVVPGVGRKTAPLDGKPKRCLAKTACRKASIN